MASHLICYATNHSALDNERGVSIFISITNEWTDTSTRLKIFPYY